MMNQRRKRMNNFEKQSSQAAYMAYLHNFYLTRVIKENPSIKVNRFQDSCFFESEGDMHTILGKVDTLVQAKLKET